MKFYGDTTPLSLSLWQWQWCCPPGRSSGRSTEQSPPHGAQHWMGLSSSLFESSHIYRVSSLTYCGVPPPYNSLSNSRPINCWSHRWISSRDPPFKHSALCTMTVTGHSRAFLLCWQLLLWSNTTNFSQWEPEPPSGDSSTLGHAASSFDGQSLLVPPPPEGPRHVNECS